MKWYKAESDTKPVEIDEISCPQLVYYRRNIHPEAVVDPEGKEDHVKYVYEEAVVKRDVYEALQAAALSPTNAAIMQALSNMEMQNEMMAINIEMLQA